MESGGINAALLRNRPGKCYFNFTSCLNCPNMKTFIDFIRNFQRSDYGLTFYHLFFGALVLALVLGIIETRFYRNVTPASMRLHKIFHIVIYAAYYGISFLIVMHFILWRNYGMVVSLVVIYLLPLAIKLTRNYFIKQNAISFQENKKK